MPLVMASFKFQCVYWCIVFQNPGMFKGVMHKVNPFKSSQPKVPLIILMMMMALHVCLEERKFLRTTRLYISFFSSFYSPCLWSFQDTQPLHGDLSSSSGSLSDNNNVPEKQVDLWSMKEWKWIYIILISSSYYQEYRYRKIILGPCRPPLVPALPVAAFLCSTSMCSH